MRVAYLELFELFAGEVDAAWRNYCVISENEEAVGCARVCFI